MANTVKVLERLKRIQQELDELNADLATLGEPEVYDVNDIPLIIGFLEKNLERQGSDKA